MTLKIRLRTFVHALSSRFAPARPLLKFMGSRMIEFTKDAQPVRFASQFGGFWTDQNNAKELLTGKRMLGSINEEEAELLDHWIAKGYVILKGAVDHALIDAALADIAAVYQRGGALIETYEFGDVRVVPVEPRHKTMPHKLLDLYAKSEHVRRMVLSQKITRFLSLVMERPPMAFQGLYFETGSEQPLHQDTAYVRVNRPMDLMASWIAMEDIRPGTGELQYYPGSHKLPDYLFGGNSKWLQENSPENPVFLEHIEREAKAAGLKTETFLPKKGDVLIWSNDLAHGGSKITRPGTRRSFVTHYTPVTSDPMYFVYPPHSGKKRETDIGYYCYSFHGFQHDPYQSAPAAAKPQGL